MLVGAVAVIRWGVDSFSSDKPLKEFLSPNGSFRAILAVHDGGGAIAPYCNVVIYVVPSAGANLRPEYRVFEGDCVTFQEDDAIRWLSDHSLQIRVTQLSDKMTFRRGDKSGQVRTAFAVIQR